MKVKEVVAYPLSYKFDSVSLRFGVGDVVKRDCVVVKVTCDDGTVGWGESHHALSPTTIAELVNSSLAPLVVGQDPFNTEGIWARIYSRQVQTHGAGTAVVIAMSGIDLALWDIKGKVLGMPVYRLMGGTKKRIRAYAGGLALGYQDIDSLEKEVGKLVDQGFTAIKLRVGRDAKLDGQRVGRIRKTFGPDLDIAVDAATRYNKLQIREIAEYCNEYNVYWLEEPFTPEDPSAYLKFRSYSSTPLAWGENNYSKYAFRDLLKSEAIDFIQADCTKAGGLTEVKKIADMAEAWHLMVAPHTSQSMLSTAANMHLMCAVPNALIYEADLAPVNPFRDQLVRNPLVVKDGYIEPNDEPGLGVDVDESVIAKYPGIPGPAYV